MLFELEAKLDTAGAEERAEQDDGDLILDNVNLGEVSIMLVSRFN